MGSRDFAFFRLYLYFIGMRSITVIGVGRVGGALSLALERTGFTIRSLVHRSPERAASIADRLCPRPTLLHFNDLSILPPSDAIFIATRDAEIPEVAEALSNALKLPAIVFHTSGSLSSDVLGPLKDLGCSVGSIHPLVSISDAVRGSDVLTGSYFCVEGDEGAVTLAKEIVEAVGGFPFTVPAEKKALYHAAAVTACGHLVALLDASFAMLRECGFEEERAKTILMPLVASTIENLKHQTAAEALTGTFARADTAGFERHLKAFGDSIPPNLQKIYLELGEHSLELAAGRGTDPSLATELRDRISIAKRNVG